MTAASQSDDKSQLARFDDDRFLRALLLRRDQASRPSPLDGDRGLRALLLRSQSGRLSGRLLANLSMVTRDLWLARRVYAAGLTA